MLSKLIFPLLFLVSLPTNAQTKDVLKHKFTYLLTYQTDSTDVYSKQSEEMLLFTSSTSSIFQSKNGFIKDSMILDVRNNPQREFDMADLANFPRTKFNYKVLKNNSQGHLVVYDKVYRDNFQYEESKKDIKWKIKPDILTINGFKCQKATTFYGGRQYEAWFSKEIPISDGPYKFSGLPGLIVKISDTKGHYVFELIARSDVNHTYSNSLPTQNLYVTDKATFFKKLKEFKSNAVERIAQSGFTIDDSEKGEIKAKLKKRNNPIELYDQ